MEPRLSKCLSKLNDSKWAGGNITVRTEEEKQAVSFGSKQLASSKMGETTAQQHGGKYGRGSLGKREFSNRKRLQALKQRTKEARTAVPLPAGKHTVFDSDSGGSVNDCKEDAIPLFGESDSSSSSDEDCRFSQHRSKKTMQLQKKIGPDKRFRLDERFAGSDSDEDSDHRNYVPVSELEAEKQQALRILNSLVSPTTAVRFKEPTLQQVYDPASDQTQSSTLSAAATSYSNSDMLDKTDESFSGSSSIPIVSNERFYSVNQDLKSSLNGESFTFEFIKEDHKETLQAPQAEESVHCLPVCSKSMTDTDGVESLQEKISGNQNHLLFFHWDHPTLCNRRAEGSFCREKSAEELMSGWDLRRNAVKIQYKRARKDALRKKNQHQYKLLV